MSRSIQSAPALSLRALGYSFVTATLVLGLAACGGGDGGGSGSETLTVNLAYTGNALLLRPSTITPAITGLAGHAPNCTLVSGTIPAGMTLNSDCSITGTPLVGGSFPIVVRLGASGVSNTLDWNGAVLVLGPSVTYTVPSTMMVGTSYDVPTLNNFWIAGPGDAVTYSIASGSLPDGLSINATTGRISGTATTEGTYAFKIAAQVVNGGRTATVTSQSPLMATVNRPLITYSQAQAFAGLPFVSTPTVPAGNATYAFSASSSLPAGLSIDSSTGVISGRPSAISGNTVYRINLTGTTSTGTFTNFSDFSMSVASPVYVHYPSTIGHVGVPLSSPPSYINNSSDPLTGISFSYALHPGDVLPPGLSLDSVTGAITGTPTTYTNVNSTVDVTVSLYGTSFVVQAIPLIGIQ
ncbi:putative Ig domain-containing protein [Ralstonia sp. CHL-2022]|uniref:Ig domain-containing protein n=1 Tax=Ralstonia mojiangensis TaxID=2953895 RepID=A0AAE3LBS6_9RALS|nr:putative Ig domain-containing protein [Ralstonia mojiangensis]MCT7317434.1 putative Ig domain-containing protein [Ralstonia mojiangensis]